MGSPVDLHSRRRVSSAEAGGGLARFDQATQLLADVHTLDEVAHVHDLAAGLIAFARAAHLGLADVNRAVELKLRAERKAGALLAEIARGAPGRPAARNGAQPERNFSAPALGSRTPYQNALYAAEIASATARRWQILAGLDGAIFENWLASEPELTSAGLLGLALAERRRLAGPVQVPEASGTPTDVVLPTFCVSPPWTTVSVVSAMLAVFFLDATTALDLTYGNGGCWDGTAHVTVTGHDLDPHRAPHGPMDFTDTSAYAGGNFDVVVFDPPHISDAGTRSRMGERFGSYASTDEAKQMVQAGARNGWRIARLGLLVKVSDHVHNEQLVHMSRWVTEAIAPQPLYAAVHEVRDHGLGNAYALGHYSAVNNGATWLIFRRGDQRHRRRS
jgi:hypothetical protein